MKQNVANERPCNSPDQAVGMASNLLQLEEWISEGHGTCHQVTGFNVSFDTGHVCIYIYLFIDTHIYMNVYMYVYARNYIHVFMHIYVYSLYTIYVYTDMQNHIYT